MLAEWAHMWAHLTPPHILLLDCPGHGPARLGTACAVTHHILRRAHLIPSLSPPEPGDSTGRRQRHGDTTTGMVPWGSTVTAAPAGLQAPGTPRTRSRAQPEGTGSSWSSWSSRMDSRATGAASPARCKALGTDLGIPRAASARPALVLPSPARSCCSAMSHRWKTNSI